MIEPSAAAANPDIATAAQRRVFHSKVDTIRPTYGFEDVSLAPGTDTIEPADVELGQSFCGIDLAIPIIASAMDAVVDVRMAGTLAGLSDGHRTHPGRPVRARTGGLVRADARRPAHGIRTRVAEADALVDSGRRQPDR